MQPRQGAGGIEKSPLAAAAQEAEAMVSDLQQAGLKMPFERVAAGSLAGGSDEILRPSVCQFAERFLHVVTTRLASLPVTSLITSPVPGMITVEALAFWPLRRVFKGAAGSLSSAPEIGLIFVL